MPPRLAPLNEHFTHENVSGNHGSLSGLRHLRPGTTERVFVLPVLTHRPFRHLWLSALFCPSASITGLVHHWIQSPHSCAGCGFCYLISEPPEPQLTLRKELINLLSPTCPASPSLCCALWNSLPASVSCCLPHTLGGGEVCKKESDQSAIQALS